VAAKKIPLSVGSLLAKPILYNPYQQGFLAAHRLRMCLQCKKVGSTGDDGLFVCPTCQRQYGRWTKQHGAVRVYHRFGLFAGRRGGKSFVGALAAREEMLVPGTRGWVCAPTNEWLYDATMPTMLGLIPPEWVADWSEEHLTLTLTNGSVVQFRSLHEPERGRGQGLDWGWFDETSLISEKAWDVFRPSLTENRGCFIATTSPKQFDWVYKRFYKTAMMDALPGFWACKYRTSDNPIIDHEEIEEARATMPDAMFRQEYEADFVNFTGMIYGEYIERQTLHDAASVKRLNPSRPTIRGLDSGADHPFGAVHIVKVAPCDAAPNGALVVVADYLERQRAAAVHLSAIRNQFPRATQVQWAANRNEAQLRIEFAQHGVPVGPAENNQEAGTQRVLSWLHTGQLWFAYTANRTIEQMKALHYKQNTNPDGSKKDHEGQFKLNDELPDCVRYALMLWPEMPKAAKVRDMSMDRFVDAKTRADVERMKAHDHKPDPDLDPVADGYPIGEFFESNQGDSGEGFW
jgi:phage terminase large subunit